MLPVIGIETLWRKAGIGLLAVTLLAGAVACGGDDDEVQTQSGSGSQTTASSDEGGGLYGDGGGGDEGGDSAGTTSESGSITIENFAFPETVEANAGATISITNNDGQTHTVTADDGAFDVTANPGQPAELTAPSEPGDYAFHCSIHSSMTSTLVVT